MADPLVVTTVAFLHIIFAIAWLGGSLYLALVLGPSLRKLSPSTGMEFIARVGRRSGRYAEAMAGLTILFGLILLYLYFGGDYTRWPLTIEIGFTFGLIAFLLGPLIIAPAIGKASDIANDVLKSAQQGPPPPEFLASMKRGIITSTIDTILLLIAAVFMVATAFY